MHEAAVKLRNDLEEYYGEHHGMLTAVWKIDPQAYTYTRNQFIKSIHSGVPQFVIVDHVLAFFDETNTATTEEEILRRFHYTNTKPMWSKDNMSKGINVKTT